MPQVKVRGRGISADDTAAVIRAALGDRIQIISLGDAEFEVHRGYFGRARVSISLSSAMPWPRQPSPNA